jgi:hypothetical protein
MFTYRKNRIRKGIAIYLAFSLLLSACTLPIPGISTQAPTTVPGISDAMLTAAAATISAHFNAQNTLQPEATEPLPVISTPEPLPTAEAQSQPATQAQPAPTEISPQLVTSTPEPAQPMAAATSTLAPVVITVEPITVIPVTVAPVSPQVVEYGAQFTIQNINLHPCSDGYNAVFKIHNQSSGKLESLSLHIQDLSTGAVLLGPWSSNAPFLNTDRTCSSGGIDALLSGQSLFLGNSLGGSHLSGHTLRTTILLCAKESLSGACTQKMVDFVVP